MQPHSKRNYATPRTPQRRQQIPDERLRRLVRHLHALGERPVYEWVKEILRGLDPIERLEIYACLDPHVVRALGGDLIPEPRVLTGGRC